MEMSPLIFMLPRVRSPISQHEGGVMEMVGRDFNAQHACNLHIPFADRATVGRRQKPPIKDDIETTLEKI